jgi:predicted unusual protein kinase regulating ubiquinone biosynthesis (AarF/ABC1/UbiB family)
MRRNLKFAIGLTTTTGIMSSAYFYRKELKDVRVASVRSIRTLTIAARIVTAYSMNDSKSVHQKCADKLLELCLANSGIYVKLGQHLASLVHLLPPEYTSTLAVLQDRCIKSEMVKINQLLIQDLGAPIDELFISFDETPVGVASLAQVHRAQLPDGRHVAVKIQHPELGLCYSCS